MRKKILMAVTSVFLGIAFLPNSVAATDVNTTGNASTTIYAEKIDSSTTVDNTETPVLGFKVDWYKPTAKVIKRGTNKKTWNPATLSYDVDGNNSYTYEISTHSYECYITNYTNSAVKVTGSKELLDTFKNIKNANILLSGGPKQVGGENEETHILNAAKVGEPGGSFTLEFNTTVTLTDPSYKDLYNTLSENNVPFANLSIQVDLAQ